ncbi:MAG: hypothetical protein LBE35_04740 [Clostridiales bacterium]|jgi:glycerophosphoryl diester phosphodiesterase|nr:hypothetical protein [Clostridiales bacterium]
MSKLTIKKWIYSICLALCCLIKSSCAVDQTTSLEASTLTYSPHQESEPLSIEETLETASFADLEGDDKCEYYINSAQNNDMPKHSTGLALVAHAAAAIEGYENSNSLEALANAASLQFRYIELDMITSGDGKIVLNHSWNTISNRIPGIRDGIMTYEEFMGHRIFNRFTPMNLDMLMCFLRENPGPRIITDTKATNYAALYAIAEYFPELRYRFIPQVYSFESVARIRALGFEDIILTVYMMGPANRNPQEIHRFAVANELYAVTIPDSLAVPSFVSQLGMYEMRYMVHTIDCVNRAAQLYEMGFYAIYTGFLIYSDNLSNIRPAAWPTVHYLQRLLGNLENLTSEQVDMLSVALIYKIDVPAYIHRGQASPVWANYLVSAPFISPINGQVYFVDRHFTEFYAQGREFISHYRVLNIEKSGRIYAIGSTCFYELFLYRNMVFISESVVEEIFDFNVLHQDDYILVIQAGYNHLAEELFKIAKELFEND